MGPLQWVIVVVGKGVRSHLPDLTANIKVGLVGHPSWTRFRYEDWHPIVRAAVLAAGGTISVEP